MAAPTQIQLVTDSTEYCRYEDGRNVVTATITVAGGGTYSSEPILVRMGKARMQRDVFVAEKIVNITASTNTYSFDVSFDLNSIKDSENISLVRRGSYFIQASSVTSPLVTGVSHDFKLSLITSEKFTKDYLFGLRLTSTEVKQVKSQPVSITGVQITSVSKTHPTGFSDLTYSIHGTARSLSWNAGPQVVITGPGKYVLKAGSSSPFGNVSADYIEVKVGTILSLPTVSTTENLIVEEQVIDESTLDSYINKAISYLENDVIYCHLEPTICITDPDPTKYVYSNSTGGPVAIPVYKDYDLITMPITYMAPKKGSWISIYTPFMSILRVNHLYGVLSSVRVIDIDPYWVQKTQVGGMLQLVPFNQDIAFSYQGLIWSSALYGGAELPNFWRYSITSGLRDLPPELADFVCKKAAIDILTILGAALRPGVGSTSLSRDGVSQSISYVNTQKYGNFTGAITSMKESIEEMLPKIRAKYKGPNMVVV